MEKDECEGEAEGEREAEGEAKQLVESNDVLKPIVTQRSTSKKVTQGGYFL